MIGWSRDASLCMLLHPLKGLPIELEENADERPDIPRPHASLSIQMVPK